MKTHVESARHDGRALIFLLASAKRLAFGNKLSLIVDHSFADGFFCYFEEQQPVKAETLELLANTMSQLAINEEHIKVRNPGRADLEALHAPVDSEGHISILEMADYHSLSYEFTTLDLRDLPDYQLLAYDRGFILRISSGSADSMPPFMDSPKLFATMRENEAWGKILGVSSVGDLNRQVKDMGFKQLIWIAEGLHEKRIAAIADQIKAQKGTRIIFIAGPSSSGKTTFTQRLGIQLLVNGIKNRFVSMDDYFLDRDEMQPAADGSLDFESINCIDLEGLRTDLKRLIYGEPIHQRRYDFQNGSKEILEDTFRLQDDEVLIFEGIHGLNPLLGEEIPRESLFRVYISALTQLNIDDTHPVSTSDGRLIRRIVRDHNFRGYTAEQTMTRWNSVRHGELRNIFPFQEEADVMFNSTLVYELSILKRYALPLIKAAPENTLRDRLITLLSLFHSIPDRHIPGTSILREFIGNSYFSY